MNERRHVFVCHASEDADAALTVCRGLEGLGRRCWIAPRDVAPGANYAEAIVSAVTNSRALLLLFSRDAEQSPHVRRELEQAVNLDIPIVPVRIENRMPGAEVRYYLGASQWLDAFPPPIEGHLDQIREAVQHVRRTDGRATSRRRVWVPAAIAGATLLLAAVAALIFATGGSENGGQREAGADQSVSDPSASAAEQIRACLDQHGLERAHVVEGKASFGYPPEGTQDETELARQTFKDCSWPPDPGADADGYREIASPTVMAYSRASEADGYGLADRISSPCAELRVKYAVTYQGSTEAREFMVTSGSAFSFGGDPWPGPPDIGAGSLPFTLHSDEAVVLHNSHAVLDDVSCVS